MWELPHDSPNGSGRRILRIRKFKENLKTEWSLVPSFPSRNKNLAMALENWTKSAIKLCIKNLHLPIS